jgi:hypothetical protein
VRAPSYRGIGESRGGQTTLCGLQVHGVDWLASCACYRGSCRDSRVVSLFVTHVGCHTRRTVSTTSWKGPTGQPGITPFRPPNSCGSRCGSAP